ncbi:serine/threonine protein kinase [Bradymonas sediminis]|nr:serine/threonine protein kinase [Bradymonas sediminis]
MATNWQSENLAEQKNRAELRFFCRACSTLCAEEDARCGDCRQARPAAGWTPLEQAFDPFLGRVLQERYLIDKIEGRGAASTVYRARSLSVPKRFAIKMVRLAYSDPAKALEARTRLEREVRAVGMLRSPHIVRVYEMLEVDPQWIAVVMEHIDGQTVEARIKERGPMELAEACRLLLQVANGLCEAHQNGMVHRDIKPANLMLERLPDGSDFTYLLDFGVVRLRGETGMTQGFLGTPLFASPEQAREEIIDPTRSLLCDEPEEGIDARSDIYSLGATFYYMLTGRAPFAHADTVRLLQAHLQTPAPTLAQGCPGRSFPAAVEKLVASMLAKSREDRPANIFRVIDALQALEAERHSPASGSNLLDPITQAFESAEENTAQTEIHDKRSFKRASSRPFHDSGNMLGLSSASQAHPHSIIPNERSRHQTKPGGEQRPQTNPRTPLSTTLERLEQRTVNGQQFARNIRTSGVGSAGHIGFADSHNEVWTLSQTQLTPRCTPASRVCALTTSDRDVFVGLMNGSVHRVLPNSRDLEQLLPTPDDAAGGPIDALSSTPSGHLLLAATADGALFIGERTTPDGYAWSSHRATQPIDALAVSPQGSLFAAASPDHRVRIAAPTSPRTVLTQFHTGAGVVDMAFSTGGDLLAVLLESADQLTARVQVFQVLHARKISEFTLNAPLPRNLYFSAHDMLHGVCAAYGRVGSWNLMSTKSPQRQPTHPEAR